MKLGVFRWESTVQKPRSRMGQWWCQLHWPAAAREHMGYSKYVSQRLGRDWLCFKKVIYALIGLEASLFQALVCLSQWPYLLMH